MAILEVKNVSFRYPNAPDDALKNVSFTLEKGEFSVLCGATGSGKSTLLRLLKNELKPLGDTRGEIMFDGKPLDKLDARQSAARIGFVMQKPEQQIVTDKVWHELAFGLENLGVENGEIRRRVSEMACFFGIESWFNKRVSELSGGQKQLLNLAGVMVMQPEILLLDEPTAQLDPIAASEFISAIARLNRELSLTVIMIEHRLEEALPHSQSALFLKDGRLIYSGETRACAEKMRSDSEFAPYLPAAARLCARFDVSGACPLTVNEGRRYIEENFASRVRRYEYDEPAPSGKIALEFKNVFFRYGQKLGDVLKGLSFRLYENEVMCVLGANGSGKSTMLAAAAALIKPYAGQISAFGQKLKHYKNQSLYDNCLALLPQDVQTVFLKNSVREELEGTDASALPFSLDGLYDMHPYDLSGGQQQLLALAKVLATKPRLLLLDEPTKGLDANTKNEFRRIIKQLKQDGVTVLCVTHDVEFASEIADRCAMFFMGEITALDETRRFFDKNSFYTTAINRMTRFAYERVATVDDAEKLLRLNGRRK